MIFATYLDMVKQYDVGVLGQLASDNDTPVPETSLAANRYIVHSLARASGDIRMCAQAGLRYSDQMLETEIYGSSDTSISIQIISLCVDLAFGHLIDRRVMFRSEYKNLLGGVEDARQRLVMLRNGEKIFTLGTVEEAGAAVDVVPVVTSGLNSITRSLPRFFPPSLPAGKNRFGNYY